MAKKELTERCNVLARKGLKILGWCVIGVAISIILLFVLNHIEDKSIKNIISSILVLFVLTNFYLAIYVIYIFIQINYLIYENCDD